MWAQQWNNLLDIMQPYDKESVDVTDAMVEQVRAYRHFSSVTVRINHSGFVRTFLNLCSLCSL